MRSLMRFALLALSVTGCLDEADPAAQPPDLSPDAASTFGRTTAGTTWLKSAADYKRASKFTLSTADVTVSKLTAYLDGGGASSGSQALVGVVYDSDSTGAPGALLCKTSSVTIAAGQAAAWKDLPISGTCTLQAAKSYYLGFASGATNLLARVSAASSTGAEKYNADVFSDGPSTPFGTPSSAGYELAIYATYAAAATSFASVTSYPAPSFTPTRTIDVTTQAAFMTAWNNIQAGDLINVHGVRFTGQVSLVNKKLASWAEIHFDSATKFVGVSSATSSPDVWIHDDSHIRFYGGELSQPASGGMAGSGILMYQCSYITWWNFVVHDTGGTGVSMYPVSGVIDHADIKGEVYHWGQNWAWDPHAEKGSGLHGMNIGDANYGVTNSRIALYAHDGIAGAGIEWGGKDIYGNFQNNTFYAWCQNLTFKAQIQTGGNCMQVWGQNVFDNDIKYLEAENLQGRAYHAGGMYGGQSLATDKVEYGRASNVDQNPKLAGYIWDPTDGTMFVDVSPKP